MFNHLPNFLFGLFLKNWLSILVNQIFVVNPVWVIAKQKSSDNSISILLCESFLAEFKILFCFDFIHY